MYKRGVFCCRHNSNRDVLLSTTDLGGFFTAAAKIGIARLTHSKLVNLWHELLCSIYETQRRHFGGVLAHVRSWVTMNISAD